MQCLRHNLSTTPSNPRTSAKRSPVLMTRGPDLVSILAQRSELVFDTTRPSSSEPAQGRVTPLQVPPPHSAMSPGSTTGNWKRTKWALGNLKPARWNPFPACYPLVTREYLCLPIVGPALLEDIKTLNLSQLHIVFY